MPSFVAPGIHSVDVLIDPVTQMPDGLSWPVNRFGTVAGTAIDMAKLKTIRKKL